MLAAAEAFRSSGFRTFRTEMEHMHVGDGITHTNLQASAAHLNTSCQWLNGNFLGACRYMHDWQACRVATRILRGVTQPATSAHARPAAWVEPTASQSCVDVQLWLQRQAQGTWTAVTSARESIMRYCHHARPLSSVPRI